MDIRELTQKAREIRRKAFEAGVNCGQAHLGGAFSCVELLLVLYDRILNITPKNVNSPDRDRFIFKNGHCPLTLYAILVDKGFLDKDALKNYGKTSLPGHLDYHTNGIEMTSGSLGHGLAIGCGIALAAKLDKKDYKTYVMLGDTECAEGSIWEGAMMASSFNLNNLIVIVDNNKLGVLGETNRYAGKSKMIDKWHGFGWNVYEINGHNFEEIINAFEFIKKITNNKPSVIIANTTKGKGVSFMEGNPKWHHGIPKGIELEMAYKELEEAQIFFEIIKENNKIEVPIIA